MALIARKGQGSASERLRHFVAEHIEALEPGLRVLETSLRLGRSTVDVVAVDAKQTLVLVAVAEVADATMLISSLDAYIWCVAFPDNVRRLYPDASIATSRPPRAVFVAAQMPAAFLDLVERLSVINPECHELAPAGDREDALSTGTAAASALELLGDLPVAVTEPPLADPEPTPVSPALQPAAQVSAGFDAAVARQWETFLAESAPTAPALSASPSTPVAASTPTWPPRVQPGSALRSVPEAQASNGQPVRPHAPATNGQAGNGHGHKGHGANGHRASLQVACTVEGEAPLSRSAVANGQVSSGRLPIVRAAEGLVETVRATEPAGLEHAAVNLGLRPRVEVEAPVPAAPSVPAAPVTPPLAARASADSKPAAPRSTQEETRTVNHPALQALKFPKSGVSRQWQEFLDQLAANQ